MVIEINFDANYLYLSGLIEQPPISELFFGESDIMKYNSDLNGIRETGEALINEILVKTATIGTT